MKLAIPCSLQFALIFIFLRWWEIGKAATTSASHMLHKQKQANWWLLTLTSRRSKTFNVDRRNRFFGVGAFSGRRKESFSLCFAAFLPVSNENFVWKQARGGPVIKCCSSSGVKFQAEIVYEKLLRLPIFQSLYARLFRVKNESHSRLGGDVNFPSHQSLSLNDVLPASWASSFHPINRRRGLFLTAVNKQIRCRWVDDPHGRTWCY